MKKSWLIYFLAGLSVSLFFLAIFFSLFSEPKHMPSAKSSPVVVTIYPLQYLAERLLLGVAEVRGAVPAGAEPHDFEPRPQDVAELLEAPIVIANGAHVDGWVLGLKSDIEKRNHKLLVLADHLSFLPLQHDEEESSHEEEEGDIDPHMWLDPVLMKDAARLMRDDFKNLYQEKSAVIDINYNQLLEDLEHLDTAYRTLLATCQTRTAIVSHNAFSYIGKRYNIEFVPIAGVSPENEPSPQRLAEVANIAQEKKVTTIFFETLVSPDVANVVAKEVGVKTDVLNPIEGLTSQDQKEGNDYLSLMMNNAYALKSALVCQ